MTRVGEFDRFYEATRKDVLAIAYAMCADRQRATRVTAAAYRAAWRKWTRVRQRDPFSFVLVEVWRHTGLGYGIPVVRLRRERDADRELLAALTELDDTTRHLISLLAIAKLEMGPASNHVGLDEAAALELAERGFARLEGILGEPLDSVVDRIESLRQVTAPLEMPSGPAIRTRGNRERRLNLGVLFTASIIATLFGGLLVSQGTPLDPTRQIPPRERLGAESSDITLDAQRMSTKDLLTVKQVSGLNTDAKWTIDGTDLDPANVTPYATCPTRRFADTDPLRVFVRAYSTTEGDRVVQSIEVSRSERASQKAFKELVNFYADCEHPRVRLVDAWRMPRAFGDFTILRLRAQREPSRFITVGFAQSGALTSTIVHEQEGAKDSDVYAFARALNDSVRRVCEVSGGVCSDTLSVLKMPPPPIGNYPAFLSVVDMPPLKGVDKVWSSSELQDVKAGNPASTPCLEASFAGRGVTQSGARLYAIPDAETLPESFAIAETVGIMSSEETSRKFVRKARETLEECTKGDRAVTVDDEKSIKGDGFQGTTWRVTFDVGDDEAVTFQMGIVRRSNTVAQVLVPPAGEILLPEGAFRALVTRAGERLTHLARMDWPEQDA